MTSNTTLLPLCFALCLVSCEKKSDTAAPDQKPVRIADYSKSDVPILPVKAGDFWKYRVTVEIPEGITSEGAASIETESERVRTYLGKIAIINGADPMDAFDVRTPGSPRQTELVDITENSVMMRGSLLPDDPAAKPVMLEKPVPFVMAGMRPGQQSSQMGMAGGQASRDIKVVAREKVSTPAGEFDAIRLLMTGNDGPVEIRRTTWFAPGIGIVKEEKARYSGEKLLVREISDLIGTNVAGAHR